MFLTYLRRELRRRLRQAVLISLGLAVGVGLVITVTAASSGIQDAQGTVLHALYGVGTDMTVTKAAAKGSGAAAGFQIRQQVKSSLAGGKPAAGTHFGRNLLISSAGGLGTLGSSSVTRISALPEVSGAAGALALTDLTVSGTIPSPGSRRLGGTQTSSISTNSFSVLGVDTTASRVGPLSSSKLTAGRAFTSSDAHANVALVDADYAAQNKLKPGSKVTVGNSQGDGTSFTVIGVTAAPPGGAPAEVYIPLARAQALGTAPPGGGTLAGAVNTIYIAAASSADIAVVQREVGTLLPAATVTTSSDLANEVTGSLSSTASLARNLGVWLEVTVLVVAFLLASLLTMAAVSRRVREFGTLKALGWRTRRIVAQVMGETATMGVAGGLAGAGLGLAGAALFTRLWPPQTATVGNALGSASPRARRPGAATIVHTLDNATLHTVSVHLTAPVTAGAVAAAVLLAIAGGLIAGGLGGWRAGRLSPAAALARVE
jgi:putative ABC transport system permease protein